MENKSTMTKIILFLLLICENVKYVSSCNAWRDDGRCGGDYLTGNGEVAQCNPEGINPCCSRYNWCGNTEAHCKCDGCIDYRETGNLAWRDDYRCGSGFIAPNGEAAQCNPEGTNYCCSSHFWCGSTTEHCDCEGCIDYRETRNLAWRDDYRCGSDFLAPNGEAAQCNPEGTNYCCSSHFWCGSTAAHCDCEGCIDYRKPQCTTVQTCNPRAVWNETTCRCECRKVGKCKPRAVWNEYTCKCDCRPLECLPGYQLNSKSCHCQCERKTCPAGFVFDMSCCKCKCNRFSECGEGQYFSKATCQCETGTVTVS